MNEKEQFKLKLGEYIAEIRKERKMTQEELAEKVGRTAIAISNIENGKVIPELLTVFELANALQVNGYVFMHRLCRNMSIIRSLLKMSVLMALIRANQVMMRK